MGRIFRNQKEIPIPSFAYVNRSDARVFTMYRDEQNKRRRVSIGQATSKSTMHPNENFKYLYPQLWAEHYGQDKLLPHELHAGLYGLFLSASWQTSLYPILQDCFGPVTTNAVLDYAMFCVRYRTNSTDLMKDELARQLIFSDTLKSDSWYSELFQSQLGPELIHQFRLAWLKHCVEQGCNEVWLCIDGSNNNCSVSDSCLAEPGRAKTNKAVNIYSYLWAVSSKDGRPITWLLNNGGKVDSKAFEKMIRLLAASSITVRGVIVDRGFANAETLRLIRELGYQYVVMLTSTSLAYKTMVEKYAESIRWKVDHVINDKGIFGFVEQTRVFGKSDEQAYVGLFYDGVRGGRKALEDISQALGAYRDVKAQIAAGTTLDNLKIASNVRPYLTISGTEQTPVVELCTQMLQQTIDTRGFSAIASSVNLSAQEISAIYDFRDVSEKQFSTLKTQPGFNVTRVHSDQGIEAKLAVSFIAAIIRTEIELVCKALGFDTNKVLREADRTVLALMTNEQYCAVHDYSKRMALVYVQFGLTDKHLDYFAQEINNRRNPIHGQTRTMPEFIKPVAKRKPGRPRKAKSAEDENKPKRKPGRPKGSKNKKTLEREAMQANSPEPPKRKPGRPKGSKNRKTLEREAMAAAPKRGRGRPKGSKNKKTIEREQMAAKAVKAKP